MKAALIVWALFAVVTLSMSSCGNSSDKNGVDSDLVKNNASADGNQTTDGPAMTFETTEHDFGDIMQGEKVEYNFKFKNTGNEDLLITHHMASCGCTVPDYPKGAIAPGDEGVIKVVYNSSGKEGFQNKRIVLSTNCEQRDFEIFIKANVIEP